MNYLDLKQYVLSKEIDEVLSKIICSDDLNDEKKRYLDLLDEDSLVRILTEPKNALTKQYQSLFEIDGVKLEFTEEAIHEIAHLAVERKTGARGLRSIMEDVMMDMMYEIPSDDSIGICTVTKEAVLKTGAPMITRRDTAVGKKTAGHRLPGGSGETA